MKTMKLTILALLALAGLSSLAVDTACSYRWRATAGGVVPPGATGQLESGTVYLFDANKCPETNVLAFVRNGTPLSGMEFVIGKELAEGLVLTGDAFSYAGEELGVVWDAYMVVATDTHVFFSDRRTICGVAAGATDIAFDSQTENSANVFAKGADYAGPGWYECEAVPLVELLPSSGTNEATVEAADATAATKRIKILSVDTTIVSDVDYAKYFKLVATPLSAGTYQVKAELDKDKIDFDKSLVSFAAQLAEIARSGETTVTVTIECKPGLCYRVKAASVVTGTYEDGAKSEPAAGDEVQIEVPKPSSGQGFYRLEVSPVKPVK